MAWASYVRGADALPRHHVTPRGTVGRGAFAVVASFCRHALAGFRDVEAIMRARKRTPTPWFAHGLSNVLASERSQTGFALRNAWMRGLACAGLAYNYNELESLDGLPAGVAAFNATCGGWRVQRRAKGSTKRKAKHILRSSNSYEFTGTHCRHIDTSNWMAVADETNAGDRNASVWRRRRLFDEQLRAEHEAEDAAWKAEQLETLKGTHKVMQNQEKEQAAYNAAALEKQLQKELKREMKMKMKAEKAAWKKQMKVAQRTKKEKAAKKMTKGKPKKQAGKEEEATYFFTEGKDDVPLAAYFKREHSTRPDKIEFYASDEAVAAAQAVKRLPCLGWPTDMQKVHVESRHAQMIRLQKVLNSISVAEKDGGVGG